MIWLQLLLFATGLAAVAPGWLARARWVARAPRLGIAAWYATLTAGVGAVVTALVLLATGWAGAWESMCALWVWCRDALQGGHGTAGRGAAGLLLLVAAGLVGRLAWSATGMLRARSRQRHHHADAVGLLGRVDPGSGATVVAHPRPAAWLVPGRRGAVVVTSAAVAHLSGDELASVVAHERAHARGRHHLLVAPVTVLARAFPALALFGHARDEVSRLVEICADDAATVRHRRIDLARALVCVAEAAAHRPPTGVLAAAGGDATERVHRLLCPPDPLPVKARAAIGVALVGLAAAPLWWVAATRAAPWLAACLLP